MAYLAKLKEPPTSVRSDPHLRKLYRQSLLVLAASEDKRNRGASIASPTMPWVWGTLKLEGSDMSGPYHLVWPRDLYHVATAQQVAGDGAGARRLLDYLWRVQKPDGSFWQNTFVDGTREVDRAAARRDRAADRALVVAQPPGRDRLGARAVGRRLHRRQRPRLRPGALGEPERLLPEHDRDRDRRPDLRRRHRPPQRRHGPRRDATRAPPTRSSATSQAWTATTNGSYSPKPYYLRLSKDGNPNDGSTYDLGDNHSAPVDERAIVDQSFLGLVLFGAKRFDDPTIRNSLAVGDQVLKADTANGPIWHRFTFDGYGETAAGGMWDLFDAKQNQTLGRAWPILTGERGEYELLAGRSATRYLRTMGKTANDGLMLPEQVWDGRPPTGQPGAASGEGTLSATPLAWTHGQFVRLAWSISRGTPVERPCIVARRYTGRC